MANARNVSSYIGKGQARKSPEAIYVCVCSVILLLLFIVLSTISWFLVHPIRHGIKGTPADFGMNFQEIIFLSRDNHQQLKGWFLPSNGSRKTVIFAHGYRNNRTQDDVPALELAKGLIDAGYNVLMFDFRGCGESDGNMISIGFYEVDDLLGAVDFLLQAQGLSEHVAVLGFSMGASTAILAGTREPAIEAVIADSPFADLSELLMGKLNPFGHTVIRLAGLMVGIDSWQVSTVGALKHAKAKPLFLIHGDADKVIPVSHSRKVFDAAGPKASLWVVPGADHLKAFEADKETYLSRVVEFLNDNVGQ